MKLKKNQLKENLKRQSDSQDRDNLKENKSKQITKFNFQLIQY
jgi:hypothetical protein